MTSTSWIRHLGFHYWISRKPALNYDVVMATSSEGFKMALNLCETNIIPSSVDRCFLNFAKMFLMPFRQKCIKNKNFHQVVFKLLTSLGINRLCSATFEQLLACRATFCSTSNQGNFSLPWQLLSYKLI